LMVAFADTSTGDITSWNWAFGDGTTSSKQHPVHTYETSGVYSLTLTVTGPDGFDTASDTLTVIESVHPPVASFTPDRIEGNAPLMVAFADTSTGDITSWNWAFGDGTTSSKQHPVHTYETPGVYRVIHTVYGFISTSEVEKTIKVMVEPSLLSTYDTMAQSEEKNPVLVGYNDMSTSIPDTSVLPVKTQMPVTNQSVGDGIERSALESEENLPVLKVITDYQQDPSHNADMTTTPLNHSLFLTENYPKMGTHIVEPSVSEIKADWNVSTREGYAPLFISFYDTSSGPINSWYWDFGDGVYSKEQNPNHTYTDVGVYDVYLMVSGGEKQSSRRFEDEIIVYEKKEQIEVPEKTDIIKNSSELTGHQITRLPDSIKASFVTNRTLGIIPCEVQYTDTSTGTIDTWNWNFGDGIMSDKKDPLHLYTTAGTYDVTLFVSGNGISDQITHSNAILAIKNK